MAVAKFSYTGALQLPSARQLLLQASFLPLRTQHPSRRTLASEATQRTDNSKQAASPISTRSNASRNSSSKAEGSSSSPSTQSISNTALPPGWEDDADRNISKFSQLPHRNFGFNQHMIVNAEFKEALRQVLWQFRAPIRYAFAYGSGVFPQSSEVVSSSHPSPHPKPPEAVTKWQRSGGKNIDFIFGVSYTQHWHSLNIQQHRDHYSFLGTLGSNIVSKIQDNFGAGAYFNPYVIVNGMMIKYGVVNLDTLYRDLSDWDTLYMAGRLHKPVKILRDDPRIRLANQRNLISALRTALLMLPPQFTERELYTKIASISYMGDPRMTFKAESPRKVTDIVDNQMVNFRQLYLPLIDDLPNVSFNDPKTTQQGWIDSAQLDCKIEQDMDPVRRGNMVRRLPKSFRKKLYDAYQGVFRLPASEFADIMAESKEEVSFASRMGSDFDKRIAASKDIDKMVADVVKKTTYRPSLTQSIKSFFTAGVSKGWKYWNEKRAKGREQKKVDRQVKEKVKENESNRSKEKEP